MDAPLILASSSSYRRELVERLGLPFTVVGPGVDEQPGATEAPNTLALRLARDKAEAVKRVHPEAVVIGADQVASLDGSVLGKPGTVARATEQLQRCSGQQVDFDTALVVLDATTSRDYVDHTSVTFRHLSDEEIERYLQREPALDCAGSFKCEGLGISLFSRISTRDSSALIGLPLIELARMLRRAGYQVP